MKDAYEKLFELVDRDLFFKNSIENIIYVENKLIASAWSKLKKDLLSNQPLIIRGYGRNSKNSELFLELYRVLFNHNCIHIDKTNNQAPTKILRNLTPYCKKAKNSNSTKTLIMNYQVSHLFGRTKNPLLFTSPWNIAYIPKYLDPFTGHESQGIHSTEFKNIFNQLIAKKFEPYIQDYHNFIDEHVFKDGKLDKAIKVVQLTSQYEDKVLQAFADDAKEQWTKIAF